VTRAILDGTLVAGSQVVARIGEDQPVVLDVSGRAPVAA
jgi:hypothetical protein